MSLFSVSEARITRLEAKGSCGVDQTGNTDPKATFNRKWHHYALFGNINSAEMAYEMGFQRAYNYSASASLFKCAALSLIALPALIVRVVVAALYAFTHHSKGFEVYDPLADCCKETVQGSYMVLSGALLGTARLAASILFDPILWFRHEIQASNPATNENAAILIIDAQKDFDKQADAKESQEIPGGRLGCPGGSGIVPVITSLRNSFVNNGRNVVALSLDWHKLNHCSFAANAGLNADGSKMQMFQQIIVDGLRQTLWPVHCVQNSPGAELIDGIDPNVTFTVRKGMDSSTDSYSADTDNGGRNQTILRERLQYANVKRIYLLGIASNVCVWLTALSLASSYDVTIVDNGCVGTSPEAHKDLLEALKKFSHARIKVETSANLIAHNPDFASLLVGGNA